MQVCFASLYPGQLLWAACLHGPGATPGKNVPILTGAASQTWKAPGPCSATSAVEDDDSLPTWGRMQSSKTDHRPFISGAGPNPAFSLVPNSGVSQALQSLEPAELDPLLGQCSPLGFQGVIPDLCWSG